jgi:hypothetical protein
MTAASRYRMSWQQYRRQIPHVYGEPAMDGDDHDPASTTAYVLQPERRPPPSTIEGMIYSIGQISAAAFTQDAKMRRRARFLLALASAPMAATLTAYVYARLGR